MDFNNLTKEALPKEFQDRIERFNCLFIEATGKSFEEADLYEYEMGCIRQALSFMNTLKTSLMKTLTPLRRNMRICMTLSWQ